LAIAIKVFADRQLRRAGLVVLAYKPAVVALDQIVAPALETHVLESEQIILDGRAHVIIGMVQIAAGRVVLAGIVVACAHAGGVVAGNGGPVVGEGGILKIRSGRVGADPMIEN